MAYTPLTEKGKIFIRKICQGNGNSLLSGKNSYVLPFCDPPTLPSKIWTSNPQINGGIKTNSELGEKLIIWYDKYANECQIDANFIAAQTYAESGYKVWTYSPTGAIGISQYIPSTLYSNVIQSNSSMDKLSTLTYSTIEINKIIYLIEPNNPNIAKDADTYAFRNSLAPYRAQLHQNLTDNPEIMIKSQFRYMKYMANKYSSLASHVLFGYNRGPALIKKTYPMSIEAAKKYKPDYEKEGVKYVYRIFKLLNNSFGYEDKLKMSTPTSQFDAFKADVDESNG